MSYQINVIMKNNEWVAPNEFPDLSEEKEIIKSFIMLNTI
jgi:hypothetical protein